MRQRAFKDPDVLIQMLHLRLIGWQLEKLAEKYNVDRSSIYHWCKTFNIQPIFFERKQPERVIIQYHYAPTKQYKYQHLLEEEDDVNEGKSYVYYRVASRKRELIRQGIL